MSSAKDIKESHVNMHKVVCEISQHVLFQYTFVLLWLFIIIGIIVSVIGFIAALLKIIWTGLGLR